MPRGAVPGLWTLVGDEPLLVIEAADTIRSNALKAGFSERTVLAAGGNFDWSLLERAASSLSLFASKQIIELRLPTAKPGDTGGEAIRRYCEHLPDETVTIVSIQGADWQTRKSAWFKALQTAGEVIECDAPSLESLPRWIASRMERAGQSADADTLAFLAARVEGNLLAARQELEKLALLFPPGQLDAALVREAVLDVARFDPQQWVDAALAGDALRARRVLQGLASEAVAIPLLVWMLGDLLQAVWAVLDEGGRPSETTRRACRLYGERERLVLNASRRLPLRAVESALRTLALAERAGKGLEPLHDPWQILAAVTGQLAPARPRQAA